MPMESYDIEHAESGGADFRYDMSYVHYPTAAQEGVMTGLGYQGYEWVHPSEGSAVTRNLYPVPEHMDSQYSPYLGYPSPQPTDPMLSPSNYFHHGYGSTVGHIGYPRSEHMFTPIPSCSSDGSPTENRQASGGKPKRKRVQTVVQRKAANIRERRRMFHLNEAFDELRKRLPAFNYEKRLSRIETLRLAMTYISFMQGLSEGKDPDEVKLLRYKRSDDYDDSASSDC